MNTSRAWGELPLNYITWLLPSSETTLCFITFPVDVMDCGNSFPPIIPTLVPWVNIC